MTLQEIYELGLKMGLAADPRGKEGVARFFKREEKAYEELSPKKKKYFDKETLTNPYSDSRILFGDPKKQIKKVMAGIDAEEAEVLLADRLNQKNMGIDVLISHHPTGHALASLDEVMDLQVDTYMDAGVPANVAHALFDERRTVIKQSIGPINHARAVDAARLLEMPLLALHTIWDNMGDHFMKEYLGKQPHDTVGDILDSINEIPEFIEAIKGKSGPSIVSGVPNRRAGKVVVNFTGGTNPSKDSYIELAKAGVGTLVEMHVPQDSVKELRKQHINVIDCGHMAADSIGANLYLDELEKRGIEVVVCSGLIRVKRGKK